MERPKPKQADPIGENVQLDGAVVESTAPVLIETAMFSNIRHRASAEI